jgi:hypothetical protein
VKYYVEELRNPIATNVNGQIEMIYDLTVDANGLTIEVPHLVIAAWELVSLANLLSLPHLLARKIRGK